MLDDLERRVIDRRQPLAEFGPGAAFDAADQDAQHVVEDLDLVLAEPLRVMQEKVRHLAKGFDAPLGGAAFDGLFEFGDDGMLELLQDTPRCFFRHFPAQVRFWNIVKVSQFKRR